MTRKKDKYSKFDKSLLKDGTKILGSEEWETKPRYWEGFLDKRDKNIVWEFDAMNIPELEQVIKTKGMIYNDKSINEEDSTRGAIPHYF